MTLQYKSLENIVESKGIIYTNVPNGKRRNYLIGELEELGGEVDPLINQEIILIDRLPRKLQDLIDRLRSLIGESYEVDNFSFPVDIEEYIDSLLASIDNSEYVFSGDNCNFTDDNSIDRYKSPSTLKEALNRKNKNRIMESVVDNYTSKFSHNFGESVEIITYTIHGDISTGIKKFLARTKGPLSILEKAFRTYDSHKEERLKIGLVNDIYGLTIVFEDENKLSAFIDGYLMDSGGNKYEIIGGKKGVELIKKYNPDGSEGYHATHIDLIVRSEGEDEDYLVECHLMTKEAYEREKSNDTHANYAADKLTRIHNCDLPIIIADGIPDGYEGKLTLEKIELKELGDHVFGYILKPEQPTQ